MNPVERDLRKSLRQRQPSPGFADTVIARARRSEGRRFARRLLVAAAIVLFAIGGGSLLEIQRRHAEESAARERLLVALKITGSKFRSVQERLDKIQFPAVPPQSQE